MDILKAEIARKRKLLEEKNILDPSKKYFKRGELLAKEQEEYFRKCGQQKKEEEEEEKKRQQDTDNKVNKQQKQPEQTESISLPRAEVIKRLRERSHPITLFGESETQSFKRLRRIEIQEPEANRGFRNDFQEAMDKVDQAYLNEILALGTQNESEKSNKEDDIDDSVTYEFIQEMAKKMGQGDRNHDMNVIMIVLQFLLKLWGQQLNSATAAEKTAAKHKMARATYTQTQVYLKPLMRKLKKKNLPEDICDSLMEITKHLLERNYIMASDAYLQMAIGNAPWPIGVTMVGIHARTGREKIFSKNVAHVMNDETQRKYIQALKRLMTKCQEYFPTDPSRCVEYNALAALYVVFPKTSMILDYIIKFHIEDCLNILSETDNLGYYSIKIDFLKLFETYPDIGDKVLCSPIETLPACDRDIIKAQQNILEGTEYKSLISKLSYYYLKRNVYARFFGLPVCPELHRTIFPKNVDLGCFLKVTGTVVRVTQSKMLEYQRKYICMKCKYENCVEAEFEHRYILRAPTKCGNTDTRCRCSTFSQVNLVSREHCKDYQEIKIQEQVNKLSIGTIPGSMWVILENDLVDCCKPGDDVIICGTVRRRWRPSAHNRKSEVELVLQANYVEVSNSQKSEVVAAAPDIKDCFEDYWSNYEACPLKGRDQILASVCPQVYGLHLVKLAVLLTVITGSNHIVEKEETKKVAPDDRHTTNVRGQCHLLLVGDPGTGKSQLLRAAAELTTRSVFTSGAGSTKAGLTCAALREEGEWQLEAGALVLSDGGVCCIDEISHLREHDRTAIHEAMEQQTISIAKAGIVCKLNTRCAVVAACNPKGHYQTDEPLSVNVSLGTPLLSRFDLIFILLDSKNKAWDKLVSSYILFGGSTTVEAKKKWSLEKLQMYISLVGPRSSQMTKSANTILQSYYMMQRKSKNRDPSRTTVRMLDSLVRLSQAHCRLMYRTSILPMDAIMAVSLVDLSMQDCTLDDTVNALHSTFSKYPDYEYLCTAKKVLTRLNLYSIWQEELLYYGRLLQVDHKTLESEIDKRSWHIFSKYDDVTDDNIPLSSSLVTSSYFDINKQKNNEVSNDLDTSTNNQGNVGVNNRLAATLKKHATLNKDERKPPLINKRRNVTKRKRKEVIIETNLLEEKTPCKTRKVIGRTRENHAQMSNEISDNDIGDGRDVQIDISTVEDTFMELDGIENDKEDHGNDKSSESETNLSLQALGSKQYNNEKVSESNNETSNTKESPSSKTVQKLKQFQFIGNPDLNKFYDDKSKDQAVERKSVEHDKQESQENQVTLLNDITKQLENTSNSRKPSSSATSQISMFESSDCEIDFDI
ncbi:uncharacterized protein Prp18 [Epargyreus clarus]